MPWYTQSVYYEYGHVMNNPETDFIFAFIALNIMYVFHNLKFRV
jgi:hypothetical protein